MARSNSPKDPVLDIPEDENPTEAAPAPDAARAELLRLVADPEIALQLGKTLASMPDGKKLLGIDPGQGTPTGEYHRDYDREPQLRVYGGVEVKHGPDFIPGPPSYIKRYVSASGGETDHITAPTDGEGNTLGEPAKLDSQGRPLKTTAYKHWLDTRLAGKRLSGNVATDMAVGKFVADDAGMVHA